MKLPQTKRNPARARGLACLLAGLFAAAPAHAVDAIVNFSELMYHPRDGEVEWVELHNMMSVDVDLSEWRVAGGIDYVFPVGTVIAGGGYLVIEGEGGGVGALGPFTGRLDNNGERIRLRNNSDRLMDEVEYGDSGRWPVAADGSGASLAKRNPRLASELPESWTWSGVAGGTPGAANVKLQALPLQIAEVSAASAPLFWVELLNTGATGIQTDGLVLENPAGAGGGTYTLAAGVLAGGDRLVFNENTLGFRVADEGRLFLTTAGGAQVLDAVRIKNRNLGRRAGASNEERFLSPSTPTSGSPNVFTIEDAIVINEIMYHHRPVPGTDRPPLPAVEIPEEWLELYNRGTTAVDLTGWSIDGTIAFQFPDDTMIGPDEYLVVARDAAALALKHPAITIAGEFSGRLNNDHGYLRLEDPRQNPVDEVHYYDGGRWPQWADGEGASLELREPDADNAVPEAWAASDESGRSEWKTYRHRGRAQRFPGTSDPAGFHEFIFGLLDAGEFLIDDISVVEDPTGANREFIQNGDFESDGPGRVPARWRLVGTHGMHGRSVVVDNPDGPGRVLHVVATGPMWHTQNQAETTLKDGANFVTIDQSKSYDITFRAKWLRGSPHLNARLYFNRVSETHLLAQPEVSGTPGAPNSTLVANLGPTTEEFGHFPLRPAANAAARVQARVRDPDGVASVTLHWSLDGSTYSQIAMQDQGDDLYLAAIPGQPNNTKVQFYLEAEDQLGATATFPAAGADSRALYRVGGETNPGNPSQHIEILMLPADESTLGMSVNVMSNHRLPATVIYEDEVFYDVGVRYKSSQRGRDNPTRRGFNIGFRADQKFRGVLESIGLDRSGGWRFGSQYGQDEIVIWHYMNRAGGIPALHPDIVFVDGPGVPDGTAQLQLARFSNDFLDDQYANGGEGSIHNYELIYYPTTTTGGPEGLKRPQPDSVTGVPVRSLGNNQEAYRYYFQLRNNEISDDYTGIMALGSLFSLGNSSMLANAPDVIDVDQWLRCYAAVALAAVGDSYFDNGNAHNARFYHRPSDGRMLLFPWDLDFAFVKGSNSGLTLNSDLNRLLGDPANVRLFWGHMQDIVNRAYRASYMTTWINHYNGFLTGQNITSLSSFIQQRSAFANTQARLAVPGTNFAITTNGGNDFSSSENPVVLEGEGWVNIREIRLAGAEGALPVTWTSSTEWRVEIPLGPGGNALALEAVDFEGDVITTHSITITNTTAVVAAAPDNFAFTELMYHPADPSADEIAAGFPDSEEFEYCEFQNIGLATVDAGGVSFVEGIEFVVPPDTLVAPGERIVVVRNAAAFAARYGDVVPAPRVVGDYQASGTSFRNSGEGVTILAGDGTPLFDFSYRDEAPWPRSADGFGYSLVFMAPADPNPDYTDPIDWRTSDALGGNPGAGDAFTFAEWSAARGNVGPLDDPEDDNLTALVEYVSGGSPQSVDPPPPIFVERESIDEFSVVVAIGADDVRIEAEGSHDLVTWNAIDLEYAGSYNNGDGTRTVSYRHIGVPLARWGRIRFLLR